MHIPEALITAPMLGHCCFFFMSWEMEGENSIFFRGTSLRVKCKTENMGWGGCACKCPASGQNSLWNVTFEPSWPCVPICIADVNYFWGYRYVLKLNYYVKSEWPLSPSSFSTFFLPNISADPKFNMVKWWDCPSSFLIFLPYLGPSGLMVSVDLTVLLQ